MVPYFLILRLQFFSLEKSVDLPDRTQPCLKSSGQSFLCFSLSHATASRWLGNVPDQLGLVDVLEDGEVGHQNPEGKGQSQAQRSPFTKLFSSHLLLICFARGWYRPESPESRRGQELSQRLGHVLVPGECLGLVGAAPHSLKKSPNLACYNKDHQSIT